MLCYDRTKCAVDPVTLAKYTQRQLGIIDPSQIIAKITGLFTKDPKKEEYDNLREEIWQDFVNTVDTVDRLNASGELTSTVLLRYIQNAEEVMKQLKGLTDYYRQSIESSWLDPRFRDFYDFMKKVVDGWRTELLPTLPSGGFLSGVTGSGGAMSLILPLGLLALGLLRGRNA